MPFVPGSIRRLPACVLIAALACLTMARAHAAGQPQTADLLLEAPYRQAYVAMQRFPDWIRRGRATSAPSSQVTMDGQTYIVGHLCQPHDCGNNQLDIVFAPGGRAAWGLLHTRTDESHPFLQSWLGAPDEKMQALLLRAYAAGNPESR
ncbi:Inhibitor of vertebrate lysozyme [Gluconacetobacter diazotrophicus PA1 5]|nr:Ivy family c-type lysozyme inhibitor [Gluconacetobacter diazotrophicus]ACI50908.1 Inhibitor of vertebrate lysozyme [Gluconacetobacter diazotrophicus PA1 5]TWB08637.1 inhibitor of lysozyme (Ivy) [Gluconacetobacter diazotrophicus]